MAAARSKRETRRIITKMVIEICSQKIAQERAASLQEDTAIISIVSLDEKDVAFSDSDKISGVLRLRFNDLKEEYDEDGLPYGRPLPRSKDFDGLRRFVEDLHCDRLLIHCWEGTSRSAAVASAVYEFRGRRDTLLTHSRFNPNPLVYILACGELGIQRGSLRCKAISEGEGTWRLSESDA